MKLKFLHLSWQDIQRLGEKLSSEIKKAGYRPDLVVAVSRGGFPIARILCDQLEIQELACIQVRYYTEPGKTEEKPEVVHPLNANVKGKKVLISDDVSDTGHSLMAVREHISGRGALEIKIATIHYKPWSVLKPDFFVEETGEWIVYPWEVKETIMKLVSKMRGEGKHIGEIRRAILELGFDQAAVDGTLTDIN